MAHNMLATIIIQSSRYCLQLQKCTELLPIV